MMEYITVEFLEMVLDLISISFCVLVGFVLLVQKKREGVIQCSDNETDRLACQQAIVVEWLRASESSLKTISDTIQKERLALQELVGKGEHDKQDSLQANRIRKSDERKSVKSRSLSPSERYRAIKRMGDLGLSVGEIARKAKMGKAEVELALQLRKMETLGRGAV